MTADLVARLLRPWHRAQAARRVAELQRWATYWRGINCPTTAGFMDEQARVWQARLERAGGVA